MIENVQGLRAVPISLSGGVDEISPSDSLAPGDCVKMTNWRLTKDGKRIMKRAGLQEETLALVAANIDIYGYATYFNATPQFCQIAVGETGFYRSINNAAWGAAAYTWPAAATIDHVVKPLEIQGKQFVITEKGSRVIQADGGIRQIGITAPTTLPTLAAAYVTAGGSALIEPWVYATQVAMDAVWTHFDAYAGATTLQLADPYSTPGPQADTAYAKFNTVGTLYSLAKVAKHTTEIGSTYAFNFATYIKKLVTFQSGFKIEVHNGKFMVAVTLCRDGVYITGKNDIPMKISTDAIPLEKWIVWNVYVEGSDPLAVNIQIFRTISGTMIPIHPAGGYVYHAPDAVDFHYVTVQLKKLEWSTELQEVWLDYLDVVPVNTETAVIAGSYRYAVSFLREGNYGCESNSIKSKIGTIVFSVAPGLNDMTLDTESDYTGPLTKTIRVKVKTAANPDIIQWSGDGGISWSAEIAMASKVYLGEGIVVKFDALTGHTATNYWDIPCSASSVVATMQQITLSSIPTSTDVQVTARKIYRTTNGGSIFYYLTTIYDRATTTTFVDNFPDSSLGEEMEEDRDLFTEATVGVGGAVSTTIGKFSEWWDERLWIADHVQNLVYYSAVRSGGGVPEEFSISDRFVPIRRGDQGDVITAMKAYKDALYVFKRNDIFIIQKTAYGYGVYHLNSDVGCIADGCVEVVNDFLMFPSERGIEVYDGARTYSPDFSVAINKTFLTADPAGYKYMSIVHDKEYNEAWVSIPSRLAGAAAITIVWNYIRNKFFFFQFYKPPSCLVSCKDSTGKRVVKMGTRDGYVLLCDYGTADHTTAITATYRKGWLDIGAHGIARLLQTEYELPATKTLTANVYVNMQSAVFRTAALTGVTPSADDIDLRRVIGDKTELGVEARWISVEYTNAEDCGGDCKINEANILVRPDVIKNKIGAN
jgi:hypothetical protein